MAVRIAAWTVVQKQQHTKNMLKLFSRYKTKGVKENEPKSQSTVLCQHPGNFIAKRQNPSL
jgi:hypothetical protein